MLAMATPMITKLRRVSSTSCQYFAQADCKATGLPTAYVTRVMYAVGRPCRGQS